MCKFLFQSCCRSSTSLVPAPLYVSNQGDRVLKNVATYILLLHVLRRFNCSLLTACIAQHSTVVLILKHCIFNVNWKLYLEPTGHHYWSVIKLGILKFFQTDSKSAKGKHTILHFKPFYSNSFWSLYVKFRISEKLFE